MRLGASAAPCATWPVATRPPPSFARAQEEELDDLCEDFLVRDFDHRIDFQIQDSLPRLERWGLIFKTDQARLGAPPRGAAPPGLVCTGGCGATMVVCGHVAPRLDAPPSTQPPR